MNKTVVIELSIACANQVRKAIKKCMEEVRAYHNNENAEDNYSKGRSYAYLDCAVAAIEEAISEC